MESKRPTEEDYLALFEHYKSLIPLWTQTSLWLRPTSRVNDNQSEYFKKMHDEISGVISILKSKSSVSVEQRAQIEKFAEHCKAFDMQIITAEKKFREDYLAIFKRYHRLISLDEKRVGSDQQSQSLKDIQDQITQAISILNSKSLLSTEQSIKIKELASNCKKFNAMFPIKFLRFVDRNSIERDIIVVDGNPYYRSSGISDKPGKQAGAWSPFYCVVTRNTIPSDIIFSKSARLKNTEHTYELLQEDFIKYKTGWLVKLANEFFISEIPRLKSVPLSHRFYSKKDLILCAQISLGEGLRLLDSIALQALGLNQSEIEETNIPLHLETKPDQVISAPEEVNEWLISQGVETLQPPGLTKKFMDLIRKNYWESLEELKSTVSKEIFDRIIRPESLKSSGLVEIYIDYLKNNELEKIDKLKNAVPKEIFNHIMDSALIIASSNGDMTCVKQLINVGVNIKESKAIYNAAYSGRFDVMKYLIENKADSNIVNSQGKNLIYYINRGICSYIKRSDDYKMLGSIINEYKLDFTLVSPPYGKNAIQLLADKFNDHVKNNELEKLAQLKSVLPKEILARIEVILEEQKPSLKSAEKMYSGQTTIRLFPSSTSQTIEKSEQTLQTQIIELLQRGTPITFSGEPGAQYLTFTQEDDYKKAVAALEKEGMTSSFSRVASRPNTIEIKDRIRVEGLKIIINQEPTPKPLTPT